MSRSRRAICRSARLLPRGADASASGRRLASTVSVRSRRPSRPVPDEGCRRRDGSRRKSPCGAGARYRYRLDNGLAVPDPASRAQADGCAWAQPRRGSARLRLAAAGLARPPVARDGALRAACRRLGGFAGVQAALPALGPGWACTAIELMPINDFPGHAQLGLRRRAPVCARPQLRHARRAEGAGRSRRTASG